MPFALEHWGNKAIVVNTQTGKHYSRSPIPVVDAKKQLRILEAYKQEKESARGYKEKKQELRKEVESY